MGPCCVDAYYGAVAHLHATDVIRSDTEQSCFEAPIYLSVQLKVDGVFSDFVEGVVFYLRFRRENRTFPKRQVLAVGRSRA